MLRQVREANRDDCWIHQATEYLFPPCKFINTMNMCGHHFYAKECPYIDRFAHRAPFFTDEVKQKIKEDCIFDLRKQRRELAILKEKTNG
jgi:hypothetical protein